MFRLLANSIILVTALALAGFGYKHFIDRHSDEDRYNIFDLLEGTPVSPAVADGKIKDAILGQAEIPKVVAKPISKGESDLDLNGTELLERVNRSLSDLTSSVVPSVVSINTTKTTEALVPVDPFGFFGYRRSNRQTPGLGSGVIVSDDGYVLTNHHVVAGVDSIQITTHDGGQYGAKWIGSDPNVDIAVLKIIPADGTTPLPKFEVLPFGDSDEVNVGEMVLAVGNPFGLSETVTRGIVSAKQRRLSDGDNEYFQVDAVINPGNSGGPLIDIHGELIGINVAIFTGQQNVHVWQGIGLAIPSNDVREVFEAIAHGQPLIRGYLGLELSNLSPRIARGLGLKSARGAIVREVMKDSPAEAAGALPGDLILKFDGREANSAEETLQRIRKKNSGDEVALTILRQGKLKSLKAVIAERPDTRSLKLRSDITASGQTITEALGISVRDLTPAERQAVGLDAKSPAVIISKVSAGSQAATSFAAGDLIHFINRDPVSSVETFYDLLGSLPQDRQSVMIMSRKGHRIQAILNP